MSPFIPLPVGRIGDGAWRTGKDTKFLLALLFQSPLPPFTKLGDVYTQVYFSSLTGEYLLVFSG